MTQGKGSDRLVERRWSLGGYAPGGYMCKCHSCSAGFAGDKRAVTCLPCAAEQAASRITALEAGGSSSNASPASSLLGEPTAAEPSAPLRLARRALEYVGWLDGSYGAPEILDADAEIKNLALEVYRELGEEPPMQVKRLKGKRP